MELFEMIDVPPLTQQHAHRLETQERTNEEIAGLLLHQVMLSCTNNSQVHTKLCCAAFVGAIYLSTYVIIIAVVKNREGAWLDRRG
jgi:hypothetical protein